MGLGWDWEVQHMAGRRWKIAEPRAKRPAWGYPGKRQGGHGAEATVKIASSATRWRMFLKIREGGDS